MLTVCILLWQDSHTGFLALQKAFCEELSADVQLPATQIYNEFVATYSLTSATRNLPKKMLHQDDWNIAVFITVSKSQEIDYNKSVSLWDVKLAPYKLWTR